LVLAQKSQHDEDVRYGDGKGSCVQELGPWTTLLDYGGSRHTTALLIKTKRREWSTEERGFVVGCPGKAAPPAEPDPVQSNKSAETIVGARCATRVSRHNSATTKKGNAWNDVGRLRQFLRLQLEAKMGETKERS